MLDELEEYYHGKMPSFVLDTNMVTPRNLLHPLDLVNHGEKALQSKTNLDISSCFKRVEDLIVLMENSKVIVLNDVIDELSVFEQRIVKLNRSKPETHLGRDYNRCLDEYAGRLSYFMQKIKKKDPRKEDFEYWDVQRIPKSHHKYNKVFHESFKELKRKREHSEKKGNPLAYDTETERAVRNMTTDSAVYSIAYILNRFGYEICILSSDKHIRHLAANIPERAEKVNVKEIGTGVISTFTYDQSYRLRVYGQNGKHNYGHAHGHPDDHGSF